MHKEANEGGEMLAEVLREFNLCAASTYFKQPNSINKDRPRSTRSNASFTATPNGGELRKPPRPEGSGKDARKMPTQIDYVCISQRWLSAVTSAQVRWHVSRVRFGYHRFDHALIECNIKVTLRVIPKTPKTKEWGTKDPAAWANMDAAVARNLGR